MRRNTNSGAASSSRSPHYQLLSDPNDPEFDAGPPSDPEMQLDDDKPTFDLEKASALTVFWFHFRRYFLTDAVLTVALLALVFSRSVDQALYYRLARKLTNYIWYFSTLVLPIGYLIISWPIVWYKMLYTEDITPEARAIPHHKFFIMGALDTLGNLTSSWPVPYIDGSLVNVMSNAVLPFTMIGSAIFLRTRYKASHYLGAILVIYGVMVKLLPNLFLHDNNANGSENIDPGLWIPVLILSNVPIAASNIYKEVALKESDADVWYVNAWIAVYQLIFGLVTAPTVAIPFPSPAPVIHFSDLPQYTVDGTKCFFSGSDQQENDHCSDVLLIFAIYIFFNISYNFLTLYIFKRGTSVLFTVASALRLPVVDVILLSRFIAGDASISKIAVYDYYALFILIIGIVSYYSEREVHARKFVQKEELTDDDFEVVGELDAIRHSPHAGHGRFHVPKPRPYADQS